MRKPVGEHLHQKTQGEHLLKTYEWNTGKSVGKVCIRTKLDEIHVGAGVWLQVSGRVVSRKGWSGLDYVPAKKAWNCPACTFHRIHWNSVLPRLPPDTWPGRKGILVHFLPKRPAGDQFETDRTAAPSSWSTFLDRRQHAVNHRSSLQRPAWPKNLWMSSKMHETYLGWLNHPFEKYYIVNLDHETPRFGLKKQQSGQIIIFHQPRFPWLT